jgi:acetyl-CoA carboxylase biotin carboxyl carrier protein
MEPNYHACYDHRQFPAGYVLSAPLIRPARVQEVGDAVAVGDTLGLVEVMKSFTAVTAEIAGKVVAFHAEDEDAVMPGQPLVDIER